MAKFVFLDKVNDLTVETESEGAAAMLRGMPNMVEQKAKA